VRKIIHYEPIHVGLGKSHPRGNISVRDEACRVPDQNIQPPWWGFPNPTWILMMDSYNLKFDVIEENFLDIQGLVVLMVRYIEHKWLGRPNRWHIPGILWYWTSAVCYLDGVSKIYPNMVFQVHLPSDLMCSGISPLFSSTGHNIELILQIELPLVASAFKMSGFTPAQVCTRTAAWSTKTWCVNITKLQCFASSEKTF
jgi:hypothetical protein